MPASDSVNHQPTNVAVCHTFCHMAQGVNQSEKKRITTKSWPRSTIRTYVREKKPIQSFWDTRIAVKHHPHLSAVLCRFPSFFLGLPGAVCTYLLARTCSQNRAAATALLLLLAGKVAPVPASHIYIYLQNTWSYDITS